VESLFAAYHWPGNVRELKNTLLRAIPFADGDLIDLQALPDSIQAATLDEETPADSDPSGRVAALTDGLSFHDAKEKLIHSFERKYLEDLMERCEWNLSRAAREAGVDRKTVARMLKRHDIKS